MFDQQALYEELSDDLDRLIGPLFGFGEQQIRKRGQFLPYGATLLQSGEIGLEAATSGEEFESTIEILPVLHDGLRERVKEGGIAAIAVCEWVNIALTDGKRTDAIKVLVEHERGLTVAFYIPCHKSFIGGWQFGEMFVQPAEPEIGPWMSDRADQALFAGYDFRRTRSVSLES
jgi:hypothetical protein